MAEISEKTIERVASLARIKLNKDEIEKMTLELKAILGYVDKLNEVDTHDIEPAAHAIETENIFREDGEPNRLNAEDMKTIMDQAPARQEGFFKIKNVFGNREDEK